MDDQRIGFGVWVALISQCLMNLSAFMVMPFLTPYLSRHLLLTPAEIGTILSAMLITARVLPILTGPLADSVGTHRMMTSGLLLRGTAFAGFVVFQSWPALLLMSGLIGLGGALYDPAVSGVLAAQPPRLRTRIFTLHNQLLNVGVIVGPAVGGGLTHFGIRAPLLATAATFFVNGLVVLAVGPLAPRSVTPPHIARSYRTVLSHRPFRTFWVVMLFWWMLFSQLQISFPIRALELGGSEAWVSLIFLVNGAVGIAAMMVVSRLCQAYRVSQVLFVGFLITALAFGLVPAHASIGWLLVCVVIYTLGESILLPASDITVASYTDEQNGATFFGFFGTSWAVGGTIGNYLGSWLILHFSNELPWIVYALLGLVGTAGISLYQHRHEAALSPAKPQAESL